MLLGGDCCSTIQVCSLTLSADCDCVSFARTSKSQDSKCCESNSGEFSAETKRFGFAYIYSAAARGKNHLDLLDCEVRQTCSANLIFAQLANLKVPREKSVKAALMNKSLDIAFPSALLLHLKKLTKVRRKCSPQFHN